MLISGVMMSGMAAGWALDEIARAVLAILALPAMTGQMLAQRQQAWQARRQRRSPQAEKEAATFQQQWAKLRLCIDVATEVWGTI